MSGLDTLPVVPGASSTVWAAFSPLPERTKPEAVAHQIRQAIVVGLLPAGSRLPSEADLAAQFGVSNLTLRQALEIVRQQGLVQTRRGRGGGSFVCKLEDEHDHAGPQRLANQDPAALQDLADHHAAVAGAAARLAALRAPRAVVRYLRQLADDVASAPDGPTRARTDARFHVEVAAASRSARLARAELALQAEVAPLVWTHGYEAWTPAEAAQEHGELVDALARGDAQTARALAEDHVAYQMQRLIKTCMTLGEQLGEASRAS